MRKLIGSAMMAVILSSWLVSSAVGQQQPVGVPPGQPMPSAAAGSRIALIDIGRIIKNHARLKGMMEDLKGDVQRAEAQIRAERDTIAKLEERLREFQKGTQAYRDQEEDITKRKADLTVKVQIQGKEFQQRQARIYYNIYQEILQATDYFCRQHGIDVVMQFRRDAADPDQGDSVMAMISRQVVWHSADLDITDAILQELNRNAITPNPKAAARPVNPFGANQPPQQR